MLEKYDGVRGFWNPLKQCFFSRRGNKLPIPQHIIQGMPTNLFLDGEIWYNLILPSPKDLSLSHFPFRFGRESFQDSMKLINNPAAVDWTKFKYMVFDIPTQESSYARRHAALSMYLYILQIFVNKVLNYLSQNP